MKKLLAKKYRLKKMCKYLYALPNCGRMKILIGVKRKTDLHEEVRYESIIGR